MVREAAITTNKPKKTKYPKSIGFIITNEFCERFNYYGMRTILVLYLRAKLDYDDDSSTVLFHIFSSLVYFFPLIGAILADSWLGKFRTILYLSIVYAIGGVIISIGAIPNINLSASVMTVIGLVLIAVGTGGIKPCVSAFGGDQFKLPEQAVQLVTFFSLFYFSINAGSLISTSLTPILREDVHCFGDNDCYSLAFGVPSILMILAIIVFVMGKALYSIKKPQGNMIVLVSKCIRNAIVTRSKEKSTNPKSHWLDYAEQKYGQSLVEDIKGLLKILVLYLPLPVFWALFDQQGSRWTFQATRMTGELGSFSIKPDQMQVINPLLILIFIPLFDYLIYPCLAKLCITRPLQKLTFGGILAGAAFLISGFVELKLQTTYPVIAGAGQGQLRIFNGLPCNYNINSDIPNNSNFTLNSMELFERKYLSVSGETVFKLDATSLDGEKCPDWNRDFTIKEATAMSYLLQFAGNDTAVDTLAYEDFLDKSKNGFPLARFLTQTRQQYKIQMMNNDESKSKEISTNDTSLIEFQSGEYLIYVDNVPINNSIELKLGGVYTFLLNENAYQEFTLRQHILTEPNSMHMLWLIPQYVVITAGEVMFSVTGLEFSYSQAPNSMKSVLQACWLLTIAIGNLIVVAVAEAKAFESQASEFFLFAGLMFIDMAVFIILAMRYKYVQVKNDNSEEVETGKNGDIMLDNKNEMNGKNDRNGPTSERKLGISNEAFHED